VHQSGRAGPWLADQWLVEDRPGTVPRAVAGSCNVAGCVIAAYSRPTVEPGQVCYAHYWQWLRAGKPAEHSPPRHFDRTVGCYLNTFFSTLQRGVLPDPWAEDKWLWRGCFDRILAAPAGREEVTSTGERSACRG
jgi:hypothetical protein